MKYNVQKLIILLFSMSLLACSSNSSKTNFYAIVPIASEKQKVKPYYKIGIGPVQIPRLLRRPQIVIRKSPHEVDLVEEHQWGGSLKEDLVLAFTGNISTMLSTDQVEPYPWKHGFKPHYQVRINIEQLDGDLGKTVTFKARWRLLQNKKVTLVEHSTIQVPVKGNSHHDYVKAKSEAVYRLSQEIVTALQ